MFFAFFRGTGQFRSPPVYLSPGVEETGEFVVNMATWELRDQVAATSRFVAPEIDEFEVAGLTKAPSRMIVPPRVAESPVHLECRYNSTLTLPANRRESVHRVVVGQVVGIHIRDDALTDDGKLDILMNSVGIGGIGMVTDVTEEHWNRVLDVDLKSAVFISKYAVPEMINNGGGSIINVSSVDGIRAAMTKNIPYAATKGGMITVTKAMAVHHGRDNIRVNCIAPGLLYTSMTEAVDDRKRQLRRDLAPLGTEGEANDIAMAATFLASEESRWITGVLLPVDAGLMAAGPQSLLNNIIDDYEYV